MTLMEIVKVVKVVKVAQVVKVVKVVKAVKVVKVVPAASRFQIRFQIGVTTRPLGFAARERPGRLPRAERHATRAPPPPGRGGGGTDSVPNRTKGVPLGCGFGTESVPPPPLPGGGGARVACRSARGSRPGRSRAANPKGRVEAPIWNRIWNRKRAPGGTLPVPNPVPNRRLDSTLRVRRARAAGATSARRTACDPRAASPRKGGWGHGFGSKSAPQGYPFGAIWNRIRAPTPPSWGRRRAGRMPFGARKSPRPLARGEP